MNSLSGKLALLDQAYTTLSGSVTTLSGTLDSVLQTNIIQTSNLSTLPGSLSLLSQNVDTLSGTLSTVLGNVANLISNLTALSGTVVGVRSDLTALSGSLGSLSTNVSSLSGVVTSLQSLAHNPLTLGITNGLTLSGQQLSLGLASTSTNGALSSTDWNTFNAKINLTSLSGSTGISYNSTTGVFSDILSFNNGLSRVGNTIGLINGSNGQILTMSGGSPIWLTPGAVSIPVNSIFGRTGSVTAQVGDYTTDQVTEGSNLYYTNIRARTALSLATGSLLTYNNTTGILGFTGTTSSIIEGSNLYYTDTRARLALSVTGPFTYNNTTGVFGVVNANSTTTGVLSSMDWNTFNNKIGSLN
jgi:ACT domain-containing protein